MAVLGPTNTGKTHFAIERMLAHRSGIIGLPLRLLAGFCRQMATMTASDLPLDEALALVATDREKRIASLAAALRTSVLQGETLSAALAGNPARIPEFMIGLVAAGEIVRAIAAPPDQPKSR